MRLEKVVILGGGSAGFLAALALKLKVRGLAVKVIRSKDIGVIGVGEGSTVALTRFLHEYIRVGNKRFFEVARPTWKLGLKFIWGPRPGGFYYTFGPQLDARYPDLPKPCGYYCADDGAMDDWEMYAALMGQDRAFARAPTPAGFTLHGNLSYHFENEKFVQFLQGYAAASGVEIVDDTVLEVKQDDDGVAGLALASGRTEVADLYLDASGFASLLLGKTLGEPFVSFNSSLFCDRAVAGGWDRADEPIKPYTTCETMEAGWCWQIEHEHRINRGYVYCSSFISDEEAEKEFRAKNPKVGPTRVVKFVAGRYRRGWVKNVVAIGNASGFVEPLEATALGVICVQSWLLADSLADADRQPRPAQAAQFNSHHARYWDALRGFIALHYRFNTRLDTPFWRACREMVELGTAGPVVEYYRQMGPSGYWAETLLESFDFAGIGGYVTLLTGQKVPYTTTYTPGESELRAWNDRRRKNREAAGRGVSVKEALAAVHSPRWKWPSA